jgi:hypothetical protein
VNESLSKLVDDLMKEILTDEKYKNEWVRCSNASHTRLDQYVRDTTLTAVKGALGDYDGDGIDYRGVLSEKLVNEIIDAIILFVRDNGISVGDEDEGLSILKVGSEGTIDGSELVASTRARDEITYPREAFVREKWTALGLKLTPKQRGCAERIAALTLLGLGIGGNISVPGYSVPSGTDSSTSDLYLMVSRERSLPRHHVARGQAPAKRPSAPPGHKIVPIETLDAAPTAAAAAAAAGGGGGVGDDAVLTTASNTSATAGENTNIEFRGNCAVQTSEVATATPTEKQNTSTTSSVSNAVAPDAEDDDSIIDFSAEKYGKDEDEDEDDMNVPTFSSTSPCQLSSNSLPSDNTRVVTPTNVPETNRSSMMDRKLAAESSLLEANADLTEANAEKVRLQTNGLKRKHTITNLRERSVGRFVKKHIASSPDRVREIFKEENETLVDGIVSSSYTGIEEAEPPMSQEVCGKLEHMF